VARAGRGPKRYLTTVLFTDIVGSTERATELGDRAWHELLEQHNALIRRQLRRFGGHEVDTAGDGFFATFDAPAAAVACALTIVELVRQLGIEVRAGVHTGEVERVGADLRGIGVHIGSRIGAAARPGEVLVSATVHDLAAGSALAFQDRGARELKGVSGEWRLFAAEGGARFDAEFGTAGPESAREVAAVRRSVEQRARVRRYGLVAAVLAAIAIVGVAAFVLTRPPPSLPAVSANAAGVIDPASGRILAEVPLGSRPEGIAIGEGAVWVTDTTAGTVSRIDPDRRAVVQTIEVGNAPRGIVVDGGSVWVTNSSDRTVSRINVGTDRVVQTIDVGGGPGGIAARSGAVWVANETEGTVSRIEEATGKVVASYPVPGAPSGVAAGDTGIWVAMTDTSTVVELDPNSGQAIGSIAVGNGPRGLAIGDSGALWVANSLDGTVSRVDTAQVRVTATVQVGEGPSSVVASPGAIWVSCTLDGTIRRIDPTTTSVTTIDTKAAPVSLALSDKALWITAGASATSHRGGTLRVVAQEPPDFADPALAYSALSWSILSMTNDGLVAFQRTGGIAGSRIVPDLAVALPKPTDDGKTYTFQLRPGLTYSDGQPVRPEDFRHALERQYTASPGAALPPILSAIVGEDACQASSDGTCDLSAGIQTDAGTGRITFHLTEPDADFLVKLALPFAVGVPASVGDKDVGKTPIPATGAYMVGAYGDQEIRLVRNPRFHEWSRLARPDGYPDEIIFSIGSKPEEQLDALIAGSADAALWGGPGDRPAGVRLETARLQHPELIHTWTAGVISLFMNVTTPPFDSLDVRRAVNLAIDRHKAVDTLGGPLSAQLSCQLLPPDLQGYRPYCPYTVDPNAAGTWTGPDIAAAQALIAKSGRAGTRVSILTAGPFDALGAYLVSVLGNLGLPAQVGPDTEDVLFDPEKGPKVQAAITGWFADYPAASGAIVPLVGCNEPTNLSRVCDDGVNAAVARANSLQEADYGTAAAAWADADRTIVDLAPVAALANRRGVDLVGSRVGNYEHHPEWLVLYDQLWVQ
jgi:YVTN family beta-propeller protein